MGVKRWVDKDTVPTVCPVDAPARGERRLLPICVCCRETPTGGIRDGLVLHGRFLCSGCEQEITALTTADPRYPYFRDRIREFLDGYFVESGPLP